MTGKQIFSKKKQFKNSGISITESLTKLRMSRLAKAREEFGFRNVWTVDDRILLHQGKVLNFLKHTTIKMSLMW